MLGAAREKHKDVAELLISKGAAVNAKDKVSIALLPVSDRIP